MESKMYCIQILSYATHHKSGYGKFYFTTLLLVFHPVKWKRKLLIRVVEINLLISVACRATPR